MGLGLMPVGSVGVFILGGVAGTQNEFSPFPRLTLRWPGQNLIFIEFCCNLVRIEGNATLGGGKIVGLRL